MRITTESPADNFRPDTGKIELYRSPGGNGVRLDAGNGFAVSEDVFCCEDFFSRGDFCAH